MAFQKLPPITVLPGGRKVRDYSSLSPQKAAERAQDFAGEEEELEPEEEPKPKAKKQAAPKAEDESVG